MRTVRWQGSVPETLIAMLDAGQGRERKDVATARTCKDCKYCPLKPKTGKSQVCLWLWLGQASHRAWLEDGTPNEKCPWFEPRPAPTEGQCCGSCFFYGEQVAGVCGEQDINCDARDGQECGMYHAGKERRWTRRPRHG